MPLPVRRTGPILVMVLGLLAPGARRASAGDITAFVSLSAPADRWNSGYGATLSSTWFNIIQLEIEAARTPGQERDGQMTYFTGGAFLAPPIGKLTPFGGVGVGVFRQSLGSESDLGTLRAYIVGAKLRLGIVILKAEYRKLEIAGPTLAPITARVSAGAGISF